MQIYSRTQDGGFGFDQSKKYATMDNLEEVCVQGQTGQHKKCLKSRTARDL